MEVLITLDSDTLQDDELNWLMKDGVLSLSKVCNRIEELVQSTRCDNCNRCDDCTRYDDGYVDGEDEGYHNGKEAGFEEGKVDGFREGYEEGLAKGRSEAG
jgi:hypothetical protein